MIKIWKSSGVGHYHYKISFGANNNDGIDDDDNDDNDDYDDDDADHSIQREASSERWGLEIMFLSLIHISEPTRPY